MTESESVGAAVAEFRERPGILPLTGKVQHYEWGGTEFIPRLLGQDNPEGQPFAELWIGAHASAPSDAHLDAATVPLTDLQAAAPEALLGPAVTEAFGGRLPYLYKVLDARQMLSIQAHPTKAQAEEGFRLENEAGIDLKAPNRNYKDDNHKPEVHVALTEFWMLHGFRPLEEIAAVLSSVPEFAAVMPDFGERLGRADDEAARKDLLRDLYGHAMTMPQPDVDAILNPLIERLERENPTDKDTPNFWARRAARVFPLPEGHRDRGILSIYLLNLVHLQPGQGTYQAAGQLHAYLEGVNMELMANSDNVLRGGLTPKHVDVPELMRTLTFESGHPDILDGEANSDTETVYRTLATEFEISRIALNAGQRHGQAAGHGPDAIIVMEGAAEIASESQAITLTRGQIVLAPDAVGYSLEATHGPAILYRATVPVVPND